MVIVTVAGHVCVCVLCVCQCVAFLHKETPEWTRQYVFHVGIWKTTGSQLAILKTKPLSFPVSHVAIKLNKFTSDPAGM